MAECIEREALKELVKKHFKLAIDAGMYSLDVVDTACAMTSLIDGVDKADVAEVRHGRWTGLEYDGFADGDPAYNLWECSECGEEVIGEDVPDTHLWCHNCGARMDGGADNGE